MPRSASATLAIFLLLALATFGCRRNASHPARSGEIDSLPSFSFPSVSGSDSVRSSDLSGKPSVVIFWATWCPACVQEMNVLKGMAGDTALAGVRFALLSVDDPSAGARMSIPRMGLPFPVGMEASPLLISLGIETIPRTFVLDSKGRVARSFEGGLEPGDLRAALREAKSR